MKLFLSFLLLISLPISASAAPSGGGGGGGSAPAPVATPSETPSPTPTPTVTAKNLVSELAAVNALLKANNFNKALSDLVELDREFPNNAEVNNLLGFAARNLGQYPQSAIYYQKALRIDPNHLGALEYQGELFVKTKKIKAAKRNLAKLKRLCGTACPEYQDLNKAIKAR
jgi:tetratricopeptide (TPR) repeat protein